MSDRLPVQFPDNGYGYANWIEHLGGRNIPNILGEAAWKGYAADGHGSQSCQRIHERGGFSLTEIGYYVARAIDEGLVKIEMLK